MENNCNITFFTCHHPPRMVGEGEGAVSSSLYLYPSQQLNTIKNQNFHQVFQHLWTGCILSRVYCHLLPLCLLLSCSISNISKSLSLFVPGGIVNTKMRLTPEYQIQSFRTNLCVISLHTGTSIYLILFQFSFFPPPVASLEF